MIFRVKITFVIFVIFLCYRQFFAPSPDGKIGIFTSTIRVTGMVHQAYCTFPCTSNVLKDLLKGLEMIAYSSNIYNALDNK